MHVYDDYPSSSHALPLDGGLIVARAAGSRIALHSADACNGDAASRLAVIVPCLGERARDAVLILARGVRATVEGFPCLPAHVLVDRDEVEIEGARFLFGAYEAQPVREYRAEEPARRCARCTKPLQAADLVGACPRCGSLFHHDPSLPAADDPADPQSAAGEAAGKRRDCDRYDDECPVCRGSRAAMVWTPADLENRSV